MNFNADTARTESVNRIAFHLRSMQFLHIFFVSVLFRDRNGAFCALTSRNYRRMVSERVTDAIEIFIVSFSWNRLCNVRY